MTYITLSTATATVTFDTYAYTDILNSTDADLLINDTGDFSDTGYVVVPAGGAVNAFGCAKLCMQGSGSGTVSIMRPDGNITEVA